MKDFSLFYKCSSTRARTAKLNLHHGQVNTPVFMPVGSKGAVKGVLPEQLKQMNVEIILANTYHMENMPGSHVVKDYGYLHKYSNWDRPMLTDSGGFQMVSLSKLAKVTEEGVVFNSPVDGSEMMLTPEKSIEIQNNLGADIIMQLDDVVSSQETDQERVDVAMHRSIRWLDRCIAANKRADQQLLFPIVQGGLNENRRIFSAKELVKRDTRGYAIGGLSGGESKHDFWKMVSVSCLNLPVDKPRYVMGVGYPEDIIVCVALGADMFDCVSPTRRARFGNALVDYCGSLSLSKSQFKNDDSPIDKSCDCFTCQKYTRAMLNTMIGKSSLSCTLISIHNITYQMKLMARIRKSIQAGEFVDFCRKFMKCRFTEIPQWIVDAFKSMDVDIKQ